MPLTTGTKLGPYEIVSPLGSGGMGEVYRAKDTRLDRTVAIKILPEHLAANSEARQRFEREARSISALNHPNICVLHDIGSQNGTSYLVMEYVEGETLEERLQKGPLPLKQALAYGVQICEALEKAHRAGIVHRDLKPGNIMLTAAGAKLLDFGLAKPIVAIPGKSGSSSDLQITSAATINLTALTAKVGPLTQQGSIVGTFQFMAPEVLQGKEADARSDIFSLGCVLYEMVSGRRAFQGKSQLSVMTAILESEPERLSRLQPLTPAALDHVVESCLAKEPDARWQNAADVGRELRWIADSGLSTPAATPIEKRSWRERGLWAAAVIALLAGLLWFALREHPSLPNIRAYLPPPQDTGFDFTGDFSGPPAITADGTAVAFCARGPKERSTIWVKSLNELSAHKLEGTEGASFPFWSADGKSLGFFADGHLKKVPAVGGPVIVLAEAQNPRGGTWNQNNIILFEPDYRNSLWQVNAAGGAVSQVTKLEAAKHTTHRWPTFLPDGEHFLFFATSHSGGTEQGIYYGSLKDGSFKRVVEADSQPQYASGYLLYHGQSQLVAQRFDVANGTVSGEPTPVASSVEYDPGTWHSTFTASQNGLMLYEPGTKSRGVQLIWMDRTGKMLGNVTEEGPFKGSGRFSPDGKRLVVSEGDPQNDIWVLDLQSGGRTRLTFGGGTHLMPSWSSDGKRVVYVKQNGPTLITGTSIAMRQASGAGQEEELIGRAEPGTRTLLWPELSPDEKYLVYMQQSGPTNAAIWAMPLSGDRKAFPVVQSSNPQARIVQFSLSRDGQWLAYSSTESGREEVYVTHFPSGEGRWQVSQTSGTFPQWRGDGKEIFFVALSDGMFRAAPVNTKSGEFEVGPPQSLFAFNFIAPTGIPYGPSPDGSRFVLATYPESVPTPLVVVTNWTADLKK